MNKPKTKNDYKVRRHVRIRARVNGTAECPRLVVNRSLRFTYAQLVNDETHTVVASAHDMKAKKGSKLERAKEIGKELGEKAMKLGVSACVFDRNGYKYHGRVKAVAEGAREAGLKF